MKCVGSEMCIRDSLTTAMLLAPAIGTGIVLQHKDWPLWAFQLMALWSGVGLSLIHI